MYFMDWTWFLVLPGLLLGLWAQAKVSGAFSRYSKVRAASGLTGSQLAQKILHDNGVDGVSIQRIEGSLTDNFDPQRMVLSLSSDVYDSASVAALGVAAPECGPVMQRHEDYAPLNLRSVIVPAAGLGGNLSWPIFLAGMVFSFQPLLMAGIILFALTVVFTLITLPVEFNASRRALRMLDGSGALTGDELSGAKKVLDAAALTYVASALAAILQLVRLLALSNRRRD